MGLKGANAVLPSALVFVVSAVLFVRYQRKSRDVAEGSGDDAMKIPGSVGNRCKKIVKKPVAFLRYFMKCIEASGSKNLEARR